MTRITSGLFGLFIGITLTLASFTNGPTIPDRTQYGRTAVKPSIELTELAKPTEIATSVSLPPKPSAPSTVVRTWADTYPANLKNAGINTIIDQWGMYNRQCTSYAAWIVQSEYGYHIDHWYHAKFWDNQAYDRGINYGPTPTIGSVAVSEQGQYGHVAIVRAINASSVTVSEYNGQVPGGYSVSTYPNGFFTNFIRFK